MWQRRSTQWLFIFGAWTLPGLYFAIQVYLQRVDQARPITLTQALLRGVVFWLLVGRFFSVDTVAGPDISDPTQGMAGRIALSCARRIHFFIRPPAPLRGDIVPAEQGAWPYFPARSPNFNRSSSPV